MAVSPPIPMGAPALGSQLSRFLLCHQDPEEPWRFSPVSLGLSHLRKGLMTPNSLRAQTTTRSNALNSAWTLAWSCVLSV